MQAQSYKRLMCSCLTCDHFWAQLTRAAARRLVRTTCWLGHLPMWSQVARELANLGYWLVMPLGNWRSPAWLFADGVPQCPQSLQRMQSREIAM